MQSKRTSKARHPGIAVRHSRSCAERTGGECSCKPTYQAAVWSARDGKLIRKTFGTLAEARAWRSESQVGLRRGTMKAPSRRTLRQAADAWLEGAKARTVRTRSGDPYKPSVLRGYEAALESRILSDLGGARLSDIRRVDVQDLADRLSAQGLDPSTVRNALMPLRAIFRRAVARGDVAVNPTLGIELPAVRGKRDRIASPSEAAELLAALPARDRALWATAMYAGLRRGELQALRWENVDLASGVIRVERSWDAKEGAVEPKSSAGRRTVPVLAALRDYLVEHKLRTGRAEGLVFGSSASRPFTPSNIRTRAETAWTATNAKRREDGRDPVDPIGLHECRHTFASILIAAGVNAKALSSYLGHSSIVITYDRYGHLMPGNEGEAAALVDAYLERADTAARLAQVAEPETAGNG